LIERFISVGASATRDALGVLKKTRQGNVPMRIGDPFVDGAKTSDRDAGARENIFRIG
jgi:hypothetical protein